MRYSLRGQAPLVRSLLRACPIKIGVAVERYGQDAVEIACDRKYVSPDVVGVLRIKREGLMWLDENGGR